MSGTLARYGLAEVLVRPVLLLGAGRVIEGMAYVTVSVLIGLAVTAAGIGAGSRIRRRPVGPGAPTEISP